MIWSKEDSDNLRGIRIALEKLAEIEPTPLDSSDLNIEMVDEDAVEIDETITADGVDSKLKENSNKALWEEENLTDDELEFQESR